MTIVHKAKILFEDQLPPELVQLNDVQSTEDIISFYRKLYGYKRQGLKQIILIFDESFVDMTDDTMNYTFASATLPERPQPRFYNPVIGRYVTRDVDGLRKMFAMLEHLVFFLVKHYVFLYWKAYDRTKNTVSERISILRECGYVDKKTLNMLGYMFQFRNILFHSTADLDNIPYAGYPLKLCFNNSLSVTLRKGKTLSRCFEDDCFEVANELLDKFLPIQKHQFDFSEQ